jgi:hypothetical protein
MRKFFLALSLSILLPVAHAQSVQELNKPVSCVDFDLLVKELTGPKYQEIPVWIGNEASSKTRYSLFVNPNTGDWTLIQFGEKIACILGAGQRSQGLKLGPGV